MSYSPNFKIFIRFKNTMFTNKYHGICHYTHTHTSILYILKMIELVMLVINNKHTIDLLVIILAVMILMH